MKNLFKSMMAIAVAAMSFTSCSTDVTEDIAPVEKFTVKINAVSPESRTVFGDINEGKYPTLWEGDEKILASLNCHKYSNISSAVSPESVSPDKKTATFEVSLTAGDNPEEGYVIDAICPASAWVSGVNSSFTWNLEIPNTQTPTATSCDPAAQILVGQATSATAPTSVDIAFKHFTAYAKFSFINVVDLGSAKINSIVIESTQNIAGRYNYYVRDNGDYSAGDIVTNAASQTITINTTSLTDIWVALAPADVSETELKFVINTSEGTLSKRVVMPANRKFESGKIATFNVDMDGINIVVPVVYTLVTDPAVLAVGDNIIIAAAESDNAMSTNQKTNNRGATTITKVDNTIVDPSADVEIFTLEKGTKTNTYAFKGKNNKYIFAASSSGNNLKSQNSSDDNSSWTVDITNGVATMLAQGPNTRNYLQHNNSGSNNLFACYAPSSSYNDVALYYKSNGGEVITIEPQISANDVTGVSYEGVTNATLPVVIRGISGTVTVTPDGTIVTSATLNNNVVTYSVAENTGSTTRTGTITLSNGTTSHTVNVEQGKPVTVTLPYSETFAESQGDWTIKDVDLGGASAIWTRNSYNGTFYMKASGYSANANTESWLISPVISLEGATNPQISFSHAQKYATNTQTEYLTLHVRTTGAKEWTQLTIPTYDTSNNYTWTDSGTISLTAYKDQNIQIGFKYVSDPSNEATWEIKDISVKEAE